MRVTAVNIGSLELGPRVGRPRSALNDVTMAGHVIEPPASASELSAIAPYEGAEFHAGLRRLLGHPSLPGFTKRCFPALEFGAARDRIQALKDVDDFQAQFISKAVQEL